MIEQRATAICLVIALGALGACSRQPAANAVTADGPAAATPATSAAAQSGQLPPATARGVQAGTETVTGFVLETMNASNYTYVRVKTDKGDLWAASSQIKIAVGDRVVIPLEMPMENFHSQSLNRDFPLIYFTSRISREGEPAPPPMAVGHAPMGAAPPPASVPQVTEPIPPAPGGLTVAAVWAKRAALAGKIITLRGKVVKFNGGILDRNWLHIQDGTGSAKDGSNDLTVTTTAVAKVGDVITTTGRVAIEKDFGAGYAYTVMLEGATVVVK